MSTRVGLIGLGVLGQPLVTRLVSAGLVPAVFDIDPTAVRRAAANGGAPSGSAAEVAQRSDVSLVCVRTDVECREVVSGPNGLLAGASAGDRIILLATVHPDTATDLATVAAGHGVPVLDAPLAGMGAPSVETGTMLTLVGGEPDDVGPSRRSSTRSAVG
jgi:3-hydroxyisobutyrate dehydrogenase